MKSYLDNLSKPFLVLAPMDDVTDTVFRQIVAECASPDLYITEFVNVDGLQSPGRKKLLRKLQFTLKEQPLIAQIWGIVPENFYKSVRQIADGTLLDEINENIRRSGLDKVQGNKEKRVNRMPNTVSELRTQVTQQFPKIKDRASGSAGNSVLEAWESGGFAGVDLNMGCPVKNVIKNGACGALIKNRGLADEIIDATKEGLAGRLPLSVKTRLGINEFDPKWFESLLSHKLNMLSIHLRTVKEQSAVPAHWELMNEIKVLRDEVSPATLLVGNGDVQSREEALDLVKKYNIDGVMIGRGIFHDPFIFAEKSPWQNYTSEQKAALYAKHVKLFAETWPDSEKRMRTLNKFCKIYINGFEGAKELREGLMKQTKIPDLLEKLSKIYAA